MPTPKILVVDDEIELERLIKQRFRRQIRSKQFEFIFARNGREALDKLQQSEDAALFGVVLTDLNMPEMDGFILLGVLPEIDETLKAVVVSAYSDLKNIRAAMNRGAFDFLTKPIDFEDLEITLNKTLRFVQDMREKQRLLQAAQAKLAYDASHDELTRLPNRVLFMDLLSHAIQMTARHDDYQYAVMFLDLDRFKLVNDSLGHSVGDELLKGVATRLRNCVRSADTVARFGGDEFVILVEQFHEIHEVTKIAQRIQEQLSVPFSLDDYAVHTGTSIGITFSSIGYQHPEEVLRDADAAMYRAKAEGKGRYIIFDPALQASALERLQLETDLRQAIADRGFCLHYQPIISLSTGEVSGFEALLRWQHPTQGWISPAKFIPIAEETGLISQLGLWVFQEACHQLSAWHEQLPNQPFLMLNVNLSAMQLKQVYLIAQIEEALKVANLSAHCLKLEITESCLLENVNFQVKLLKQIKALGIEICIDDFGIGYSSLSRLHEFPIDTLKIDRSFVRRIEGDSGSFETVKMIVALAHSLGMDVVAEGVETKAQLQKIQALEVEFAQGYLFSEPLDRDKVDQYLKARRLT
jgi:diguanylate cyclase (GGDEF)-like protein